jgi:hypothetical protein
MDCTSKMYRTEGLSSLFLGTSATALGYLIQGACKFSVYELCKHEALDRISPERAKRPETKTVIYLASAAVGETVASIALCPWEATRIRTVANPNFRVNVFGGVARIYEQEGLFGLYKGLGPILMKQLPYTMVQLTMFQHSVALAYGHVLPLLSSRWSSKERVSHAGQLGVSVGCGVIAGVTSAVASHPADTVLSYVNAHAKKSASSNPVRDASAACGAESQCAAQWSEPSLPACSSSTIPSSWRSACPPRAEAAGCCPIRDSAYSVTLALAVSLLRVLHGHGYMCRYMSLLVLYVTRQILKRIRLMKTFSARNFNCTGRDEIASHRLPSLKWQ